MCAKWKHPTIHKRMRIQKKETHQQDRKSGSLGKVASGTRVLQMTLNASVTHQFQHAVVASTILHVQEDVFVALAVPAAPDGTAVFQDRLLRRAPQ